MKLKSLLYYLFLFALLPFIVSCHKSDDNVNPNDSSSSATDSTTGHNRFGTFTFTCRGEAVTCTPSQNDAVFGEDSRENWVLTVVGTDLDAAKGAEESIILETLVDGKNYIPELIKL